MIRGFLQGKSITSRLVVGYSILFLTVLSIVGGGAYYFVHGIVERDIREELRVTTESLVNMVKTAATVSIKNRLRTIAEKDVEGLTALQANVESGAISLEEAKRRARQVLLRQTVGDTGYVYCLDGSGVVQVHPRSRVEGTNVSDRDFVRRMQKLKTGYLEYRWQNPGEHQPRAKALYVAYFKPWDWYVAVSSYRDEFSSLVDAEDFRASVSSIRFGKSGYTYVLDSSGNAVIHPTLRENILDMKDAKGVAFVRELVRMKNGSFVYSWKNPEEEHPRDKIVVFRYLPEFDWIVGSSSYHDEIFAPLQTLGLMFAISGLLAMVLIIPLSTLLAQSISAPLKKLTGMLKLATDGDYSVRGQDFTQDEIGQLNRCFNQFMDALQQSQEKLDSEVGIRRAVEHQHMLFEEVFQNALEGIVITDSDGRIVTVNPAFTAITGYEEHEVVGQNPRVLKSDKHPDDFYREMWRTIRDKGRWSGEIWNRRKNGEPYPELLSISAIMEENGEVGYYVSMFHDLTDMKRQEEELQYQHNHDALTGLPNRALLLDRLSVAMNHAARNGDRVAVLYIDLDNFKNVNDAMGHAMGDSLLQQAAVRFKQTLHEEDTVARLSGDEFVVLLEGRFDEHYAVDMVNQLLATLEPPFLLGGEEAYITASVGMTFYPEDGSTPETLIKNADMAMFGAKDLGKNSYHVFTREMDDRVNRRMQLERDMRQGLKRDEFMVYYQPKVDLANSKIVGMEALVRWVRLDGTVVSPVDFIPLAEENGLIIDIGARVLDKACAFLRILDEGAYPGLNVAVNLSPEQFRQDDLVDMVRRTLSIHKLPPNRLDLEITESTIMRDIDATVYKLNQLVDMGIRVSIDDFGTGYSSMYYLKKFPIDTLKIDQSFVRDICEDPNDANIVQTITVMADNLGMKVVAEGVETEEQRELLTSFGCQQVQGFLYSPPLPAPGFEEYLLKFVEDSRKD